MAFAMIVAAVFVGNALFFGILFIVARLLDRLQF